ncbi:MAG: DUF4214 domain-containing protein [Lachnospiraceae bacterium]|nr:DUF4214 domain-containing protein [Lachnospiraceae bacterium]
MRKRNFQCNRMIAIATAFFLTFSTSAVYAEPFVATDSDNESVSANEYNETETNNSFEKILNETESYVDESREYSKERIVVVMERDGIITLQSECEDDSPSNADDGLSQVCDEILDSMEGSGDFQFSTVELSEDMTVSEAVDYYGNLPGVAFAQPDYLLEVENTTNDPSVSAQWYWEKLNMDIVCEYTKDMPFSKVKVAIVDTGLDVNHPDLQDAVNRDLCVSSVNSDFDKITTDLGKTGHGTHIAGIIGATANNGIGIAGLAAGRVEIMGIRCQTETSIYSSYAARGVEYAVDNGARLINMSLGTTKDDNLLKTAMEYAYSRDVLVICSAGNSGSNGVHYPSRYDETIGVIAVGQDNHKTSSSNYGKDNFISAPGSSIYSTLPDGKYGYLSGTSMASGMVTAVAAYVLSLNPTLSVEELKTVLAQSATDIYTSGFDEYSGWGVVNPMEAVTQVTQNSNTVSGFVNRLYRLAMERQADLEGLSYWVNTLKSGEKTGAKVAEGFIESPEFANRNLSDERYVTVLYEIFMGREPDADGYRYWLELLSNGVSRTFVANQFCTSAEFVQICKNCGITAGSMDLKENRDRNVGLTGFVARQYTKALGRAFDVEGINYWTGEILDGRYSIIDVCTDGFFHSKEFQNKNLSDEEYIKVLYRTFFDREYDEEGLQYWVSQLHTGNMTRNQILNDFALSKEFQIVRAQYGF